MYDQLGQELARACRDHSTVAVLRLDLESVKDVNATLGFRVGDRLLRDVVRRITGVIRATDTFARLGGDELALIQPQLRGPADAAALVAKILASLEASFDLDGQDLVIVPKLGIALFPQDGANADTLLKYANLALYRTKTEAGPQASFFEPTMNEQAQARLRLGQELRRALERNEFVLHYQPQLELATGQFIGVEALVRWNHPDRGLVLPGEFIPLAESNGMIRPLGEWIIREACQQARLWRERGWNLSVAVNLSPAQLRKECLLPEIREALKQAGLDPARLELEITEGVLMQNMTQMGDGFLRGVTVGGIRLALDDFGTGYSSLAYLRHLPVTTIKIDRSFVRELGEDADAEALVRAIVMLGHSLRKRVVAEGVENERQLALLRELGCEVAQGFYIARPQDITTLECMLASFDIIQPSASRAA